MKTKDLYAAIKELGPQKSFFLTDHDDELDYHVLKYNKKNKLWDYYFFNERGGKNPIKSFDSEKKACEFVLNEAIRIIKVFRDADMDAIRRKYLGLNTYMSDNLIQKGEIKITDLYAAIKELNPQEYFYLNDQTKLNTYILNYSKEKKLWEYYFLDEGGGKTPFKTFETEADACEYVLLDAIKAIKKMKDAKMDVVRNKYLGINKI